MHLFKTTHEKANKYVQNFMQAHAKRIEAEGTLTTVNHEGEIPEKIKDFTDAIASEFNALHKIESKKYSQKELDLKALYALQQMHHPDILMLANAGMKNAFPVYSGKPEDAEQFALDLYQFIHVNRQQYLFNLAAEAHTVRLDIEKKLAVCRREAIHSNCQEIRDAIKAEHHAKILYTDYINYHAEKSLKPAWNLFDGRYHHPDLTGLGTEIDPVPKLPLRKVDLERDDYHEILEAFIVRKRFTEKPQPTVSTSTTTTQPSSQPAATPNDASQTHQRSTIPITPLSKTQRFIIWINIIANHPITHTLLTLGISSFYAATWSKVALYGLGTMIFSLGFQMARRRLIEHWIKQAILQNSIFSDPSWQADGYRAGYASEVSYLDYIKNCFQPSAYCLPAYYLGRYTAAQKLPLETRLSTHQAIVSTSPQSSKITEKSTSLHPLKI